MEILALLETAISEKAAIKVKYNGGSQPGRVREIIPTKITGDKVYAFCTTSRANKSFVISKMEITDNVDTGDYDPEYDAEADYFENGFIPLLNRYSEQWLNHGWHIESSSDYIHLYRRYKNGKLLKYPTVGIEYDPSNNISGTSMIMNDDGDLIEVETFNDRRWRVVGGGDFKHCEKAINRFLELSHTVSPAPGKK